MGHGNVILPRQLTPCNAEVKFNPLVPTHPGNTVPHPCAFFLAQGWEPMHFLRPNQRQINADAPAFIDSQLFMPLGTRQLGLRDSPLHLSIEKLRLGLGELGLRILQRGLGRGLRLDLIARNAQ